MVLPTLAGGGAERVSLDLGRGFLLRGIDVDIVTMLEAGPLAGEVPAGARLFALGAPRIALALPRLVAYLRNEQPNHVVSCLNPTNLLSIAAGRLTWPRTPVLVIQQNHLSIAAKHKATRRDRAMPWLLRLGLPMADRVVAVSCGVADDLAITTGLPRNRIDVVYSPVIFDRLMRAGQQPVTHPWLTDKTLPVVVAVGRLVQQKDFETLIRAMALVPNCRLIILGEGERRRVIESLVADLDLGDRVDLPGFVANPFPFLRCADAFALSSRWEGLPTVLTEALMFEVPIVATACPSGPREILEDGRWGRLVPVGDVAALADALIAAMREPAPPRTEARARYELATATQSYLDLLPDRT